MTNTKTSGHQAALFKDEVPEMPAGYYSSGPNLNMRQFVEEHASPYSSETDDYQVPPFDQPINTTKATAIYNMHTYWSKKPHDAIRQYIRHYTKPGDVVLDPMLGSGTTAVVARLLGRRYIGYDLNKDYLDLAWARLQRTSLEPQRLELATNGTLAYRETLLWALAHRREFLPVARGRGKQALGRFGSGFLAVRTDVLLEQLGKWGYEEAAVRSQWVEDGLLDHQRGKRTRVIRFERESVRCISLRL